MKYKVFFGACIISSVLLVSVIIASPNQAQYAGFDSRLTVKVLWRLPVSHEAVTGFEVHHGRLAVAFTTQLLLIENQVATTVPLMAGTVGTMVNDAGIIQTQNNLGLFRLAGTDFTPFTGLVAKGKLFNSGMPVYLDAYDEGGFVKFVARRNDRDSFGIAGVKGALKTAAWNGVGMTAIVGKGLYVWTSGSKEFVRLTIDNGLTMAKDLCLVGDKRAVVALPDAVVLVTEKTQLILVAFSGRCRWADNTLYLLDERTGLIWEATGLERLGDPAADELYARNLLKSLPSNATESYPSFLEAVRILGSDKAHALLIGK